MIFTRLTRLDCTRFWFAYDTYLGHYGAYNLQFIMIKQFLQVSGRERAMLCGWLRDQWCEDSKDGDHETTTTTAATTAATRTRRKPGSSPALLFCIFFPLNGIWSNSFPGQPHTRIGLASPRPFPWSFAWFWCKWLPQKYICMDTLRSDIAINIKMFQVQRYPWIKWLSTVFDVNGEATNQTAKYQGFKFERIVLTATKKWMNLSIDLYSCISQLCWQLKDERWWQPERLYLTSILNNNGRFIMLVADWCNPP